MEFCNSDIRKRFFEQQIHRPHFDFPSEVELAYSATRRWITSLPELENQNIDKLPTDLNNEYDHLNTAREFTSLLPSHTLKMYDVFLNMEANAELNSLSFALDKPCLYLIDVGCGGGSGSIALLSLVLNFQKFRLEQGIPIYPIKIYFLGIDPNQFVLNIFSCFLKEIASRVTEMLIEIEYMVIDGKLSTETNTILQWANDKGLIDSCIFAFGNVIRPYQQEWRDYSKKNSLLDKFVKLFKKNSFVGEADVDTVLSLIDRGTVDHIYLAIISSPTKNKDGTKNQWFIETQSFLDETCKKVATQKHNLYKEDVKKRKTTLLGPPDCSFRLKGDHNPIEVEFNSGFTFISCKPYLENKAELEDIFSFSNLRLAWARVRNELNFGMLEDTIELLLFDLNLNDRLEQLQRRILCYDYQSLGIDQMIHYLVPKGETKPPRPMSICRIEDQIVATAFLQTKKKEYEKITKKSSAYILSNNSSKENLYENWFPLYQKFINRIRDVAREHPDFLIIQTDLTSYYSSVDQNLLWEYLRHQFRLADNIRLSSLVNRIIKRDCGLNKEWFGLPQGHIISGAFSNIFLSSVDELFNSENQWGAYYFRYVDDIVLIFPPSISDEAILKALDDELANKKLSRSIEKTSKAMTTKEFLLLSDPLPELNELSDDYKTLLSDLYRLPGDYLSILRADWWNFIKAYQCLLFEIGFFIHPTRLSRKLHRYIGWRNWQIKFLQKRVDFPEVNNIGDLIDVKIWVDSFKKNNEREQDWISRRKKIQETLKRMLIDSYEFIEQPDDDEKRIIDSKKRLKFAVNRLGRLGFDDLTNTVVDILLHKPWYVNARKLCEDLAMQNKEKELIRIFLETKNRDQQWGYIRSCAINALPLLPLISAEAQEIIRLYVLEKQGTLIERIKSSEVIFLTGDKTNAFETLFTKEMEDNSSHSAVKRNLAILYVSTSEKSIHVPFLEHVQKASEFNEIGKLNQVIEILQIPEPDILRKKYYENDYPDDDREFPDFPSRV